MIRENDLVKLGPWPAGANNLAGETSVPRASFREGVNVQVADDGKVSMREGFVEMFEAVEPHSGFGYGARAFYADLTELYAVELYDNGTLAEPMPIFDGLTVDAPLAHCLIEPYIYVSDGEQALRISSTNEVTPWALPLAPTPTLDGALLAGGSLPAGRYHLALAYRSANGEEGPLSDSLVIDIDSIEQPVVRFPPAPAGVDRQLVYLTKPNGTELLLYGSVAASATTATINSVQRLGRPCPTLGLEPMPAGRFAAYYAGRLLVSVDDAVVWSEPMHYALCAPEYNYTLFSEVVTGLGVAGETVAGFFVGQLSRTYFVRGENPNDASLEEVYPAGIVPGTLTHVPGARLPLDNPPTVPVPVWLATNGVFCVGMPDGTVQPLTEARYAANVGDEGASVFVQRDGVSRLIATTKNPTENVFAVQDSVSIEVVRNGISP